MLALSSLAEDPCQALTHEDVVRLSVFTEGAEVPDPSGKSCQWSARGGVVRFTAYPTADKTQDQDVQHLPAGEIEGRRAVIGEFSRSGTTSYTILVTTSPGRSFRILIVSSADPPEPDTLAVGKDFAAAVLRRLG